MYCDISQLFTHDNHTFEVRFRDGLAGKVILAESALRGEVFEPLRDPAFFNQAYIDHGAVTWPNGADLAPDAMYEEIKKNGVWHIT